jgi:hypothetical protein
LPAVTSFFQLNAAESFTRGRHSSHWIDVSKGLGVPLLLLLFTQCTAMPTCRAQRQTQTRCPRQPCPQSSRRGRRPERAEEQAALQCRLPPQKVSSLRAKPRQRPCFAPCSPRPCRQSNLQTPCAWCRRQRRASCNRARLDSRNGRGTLACGTGCSTRRTGLGRLGRSNPYSRPCSPRRSGRSCCSAWASGSPGTCTCGCRARAAWCGMRETCGGKSENGFRNHCPMPCDAPFLCVHGVLRILCAYCVCVCVCMCVCVGGTLLCGWR